MPKVNGRDNQDWSHWNRVSRIRKPGFHAGDYLVMCAICGMNYRRSECRKDWKNQILCLDTCFELRPEQDKVKTRPDVARPKDPRPDANVTHTTTNVGNVTADDYEPYDESDPL